MQLDLLLLNQNMSVHGPHESLHGQAIYIIGHLAQWSPLLPWINFNHSMDK